MTEPEVRRYPIMLNPHCIALLTLYIKQYDHLDDLWSIDYEGELAHDTPARAAQELVSRLEDHWTPAFMMALRDAIIAKLKEHDKECKTDFANTPYAP